MDPLWYLREHAACRKFSYDILGPGTVHDYDRLFFLEDYMDEGSYMSPDRKFIVFKERDKELTMLACADIASSATLEPGLYSPKLGPIQYLPDTAHDYMRNGMLLWKGVRTREFTFVGTIYRLVPRILYYGLPCAVMRTKLTSMEVYMVCMGIKHVKPVSRKWIQKLTLCKLLRDA